MLETLREAGDTAVPITVTPTTQSDAWLAGRPDAERTWLDQSGFTGKAGSVGLLPGGDELLFGPMTSEVRLVIPIDQVVDV